MENLEFKRRGFPQWNRLKMTGMIFDTTYRNAVLRMNSIASKLVKN